MFSTSGVTLLVVVLIMVIIVAIRCRKSCTKKNRNGQIVVNINETHDEKNEFMNDDDNIVSEGQTVNNLEAQFENRKSCDPRLNRMNANKQKSSEK